MADETKKPESTTPDVPKLIAVLGSDANHKEKADACRQLATYGDASAVPALAALLGDEKLSHMARYGLEPIRHPSVNEALRAALGTVKGRPLVGVIGSLGVRKDREAIGALAGLLSHEDPHVVATAARSLAKIGLPKVVTPLVRALRKAEGPLLREVADACITCLARLRARKRNRAVNRLATALASADLPKYMADAVGAAAPAKE